MLASTSATTQKTWSTQPCFTKIKKNHTSGPRFHTEPSMTIKGTKENFKDAQNVFFSLFIMLTSCCFGGGVLCVSMFTTTSQSWTGAAWHTEQNVSIAELPHLLVLVLVDLQSQQEVLVLHGEGEHKQPWTASSACSQSKQRNKLPLPLQTHSTFSVCFFHAWCMIMLTWGFWVFFLSSEREFDPV